MLLTNGMNVRTTINRGLQQKIRIYQIFIHLYAYVTHVHIYISMYVYSIHARTHTLKQANTKKNIICFYVYFTFAEER